MKRRPWPWAVRISDTSLQNKLLALNIISKKAESFLLKTHFPRKSAEKKSHSGPPLKVLWRTGLICDRANRGHQNRNSLTNLTLCKTQLSTRLLDQLHLPLMWCHVPKLSSFVGFCVFYTVPKSKQWNKSFRIPIWNDKYLYENHQMVNYPC